MDHIQRRNTTARPPQRRTATAVRAFQLPKSLAFGGLWGNAPASPTLQVNVGRGKTEELARALLCSERGLRKMTRRYPPLLSMEPADVLSRMLALKEKLPRVDLAHMLYLQPMLFFNQPTADIIDQVSKTYTLLCNELPDTVEAHGALLVDSMVQERPAILFIEHDFLAWGLPQLKSVSKHSTYPTDSVSCANLIWSFFGRSLEDQYNQIF